MLVRFPFVALVRLAEAFIGQVRASRVSACFLWSGWHMLRDNDKRGRASASAPFGCCSPALRFRLHFVWTGSTSRVRESLCDASGTSIAFFKVVIRLPVVVRLGAYQGERYEKGLTRERFALCLQWVITRYMWGMSRRSVYTYCVHEANEGK